MGQTSQVWLPLKSGGKWGYVQRSGDSVRWLVPPRYDAVPQAPWSGGNIEVESGDKVGIVNATGELIPPIYDELEGVTDFIYKGRLGDSMYLVGANGARHPLGEVADATPLSPTLISVYKAGRYALFDANTGYRTGFVYTDITKAPGRSLVYARDEQERIGLLDSTGTEVVPTDYDAIDLDPEGRYVVVTDSTRGSVLREMSTGIETLLPGYQAIQYLGNDMAYIYSQSRDDAYDLAARRFVKLPESVQLFRTVPDNPDYLILLKDTQEGLALRDGTLISSLAPGSIGLLPNGGYTRTIENVIYAYGDDGSPLFSGVGFGAIDDFVYGLATVMNGDKYGLVSERGEVVIPIEYDYVKHSGRFVKAYLTARSRSVSTRSDAANTVHLFELDDNYRVVSREVYQSVRPIKIGYRSMRERLTMGRARLTSQGAIVPIRFKHSCSHRSGRNASCHGIRWHYRSGSGLVPVDSTDKVLLPDAYADVHLLSTGEAVLARSDVRYPNTWIASERSAPYKAVYYHHHEGRVRLTRDSVIGIRLEDFCRGSHYAAVWMADNSFRFIDSLGNYLLSDYGEPVQYAHISEYVNGRFAVTTGPALTTTPPQGLPYKPAALAELTSLVSQYNAAMFFKPVEATSLYPTAEHRAHFIDSLGRAIPGELHHAIYFANPYWMTADSNGVGVLHSDGSRILDNEWYNVDYYQGTYLRVHRQVNAATWLRDNGNTLVDTRYNRFTALYHNRMAVREDSLWGFVDATGRERIAPQYDTVTQYSEGWAFARQGTAWVALDTSGRVVLHLSRLLPGVEFVRPLSEGLIACKLDGKWGYIDHRAEVVIPHRYQNAFSFDQGLGRVVHRLKTGVIDRTGEFVIPARMYELLFPFNRYGLAVAQQRQRGPKVLLDVKGKVVSGPYVRIEPYYDGYARVGTDEGKFGFIDSTGAITIPPQYERTAEPAEGVVAVKSGRYWYFVDMYNRRMWPELLLTHRARFKDGYALVHTVNDEDLILYRNGEQRRVPKGMIYLTEGIGLVMHEVVTETSRRVFYEYLDEHFRPMFDTYKQAKPYRNGVAAAAKQGLYGLMTRRGNLRILEKYPVLQYGADDLLYAISPYYYGLYDIEGNEVAPPEYDLIQPYGDVIQVEQLGKRGYLAQDGTLLSPLSQ